ncbi:dynein regulatory complex subunit 2 [Drosophila santomea]|uniref:dynein regulatory complex subunit 2 n=1 Tax=Drosophila santomea TaxID=129105 RepID=UPI0019539405|nr:dynein regulatory complex subunit 2 [Drosophila santomea]
MGKKGKGKGNKLAKMSEEERARYLQMRADMEEETRRRKMQLISMYMKNKLKREDAFGRLNMAKINQEWRSILRQVKIQELRREIVDVESFFQEALKRKDQVIHRLIAHIESTEDMYANLQQSHMENITRIVDTHRDRIEFFRTIYEDDKQAVLSQWEQDSAVFKEMHAQKQQQLECVFYQLEENTDGGIRDNHERFLDRCEDLKSGMQLQLEQITSRGEARLEKLWQEYQAVLAGYCQHIEGFYSEYVDLKQRDEEAALQISQQSHEIEHLVDQLANLRLVSEEFYIKQQGQLEQRQAIKQQLTERLRELRTCVEQEVSSDHQLFKLMSVESYHALEFLQETVAKGETLAQLSAVCAKMETQRERMFQLPEISREIIEIRDIEDPGNGSLADPATDLLKDEVAVVPQMESFWRRVNNVAVDVACLKQQKRRLEAENSQLKAQLQDYLVNLNIAHGSNSHVHAYLARRPKSMSVDRVSRLQLQPKLVKSAQPTGRRRPPAPTPPTPPTFHLHPGRSRAPAFEANLSNVVRSRTLARGKMNLARME